MSDSFQFAGYLIRPGQVQNIDLFIAKLYDYTSVSIPVKIIRGKKSGPTVFLSAGIHGDEINGTEIIKQVFRELSKVEVAGTIIAVPIVNVFGLNNRSRYLPDRRDLNRSFPGSNSGSLASRMADIFMREIVLKSNFGIDFHTGALHRTNLPHIRVDTTDKKSFELAKVFNSPVVLNSEQREGSLRMAAHERGIPVLLFEGGEALRNSEFVTRIGARGTLRVLCELGVIKDEALLKKKKRCFVAQSCHWLRAPQSGCLTTKRRLGSTVKEGTLLGFISDPMGEDLVEVRAKKPGLIVGKSNLPLVNRGDALFHIATLDSSKVPDEFESDILDDFEYELLG